MKLFTVAFFGHRYIVDYFNIEKALYSIIKELICEKEYVVFTVGRNGEFDQCVASTVRKVKKEYRDDNSELALFLHCITAEYRNNKDSFADYYDSVDIFDVAFRFHPKAVIQKRNKAMVDKADLIICYIQKKIGGAYKTIEYAKKQGKKIINIADAEK